MVEVFKTNVIDGGHAKRLVVQIQAKYPSYVANFDLEDCDHILRIECLLGIVLADEVISLVKSFGYEATVLADEFESQSDVNFS